MCVLSIFVNKSIQPLRNDGTAMIQNKNNKIRPCNCLLCLFRQNNVHRHNITDVKCEVCYFPQILEFGIEYFKGDFFYFLT